jgi:1-aminocyclopropane-1-carboxylate deaminase/D-cysteine desulfhydrase-like pyridoxal-dependent ACC family enzyme
VLERLGDLYTPANNVPKKDIRVWDGAPAPCYGRIGQRSLEAIRLMASLEGLFLDPVYTAKSFPAIPSLVETGDISKGARVCFVHTGGSAALYAYEDQLGDLLGIQER